MSITIVNRIGVNYNNSTYKAVYWKLQTKIANCISEYMVSIVVVHATVSAVIIFTKDVNYNNPTYKRCKLQLWIQKVSIEIV